VSAPDAAQLVDRFTSLAMSLARRWARSFPHLAAEFRSEAAFALWRLAVEFDNPIEFFAVRARWRINRAFDQLVRRERRQNPGAFRQRTEVERDPLDLAADHGPAVGSEMALREVLSGLTPREREAVEMRANGDSFSAIGAAMGLNSWQVRTAFHAAAGKLRWRMGG
jgi:RNA polymerase sigma factor (sigma-70 family)